MMFLAGAKQYIDGGQVIGIGVTSAEPMVQSARPGAAQPAGPRQFRRRRMERHRCAQRNARSGHLQAERGPQRGIADRWIHQCLQRHRLQARIGNARADGEQIEADMRIFTDVIRERDLKFD